MNSKQDLIAGYSAYTDAAEMAAAPAADAAGVTPTTTTLTISSPQCIAASIGGASAISAVSVDNTFDHGC